MAFYAPVLFRSIGLSLSGSLIGAIILGCINFSSTFVSAYSVDRFGRRVLFLEAGVQTILCRVS